MVIELYYNASPNNKIGKTLNSKATLEGSLRDRSNVINPEILIESSSPLHSNYVRIPEFNRYYFIRSIESYRTNMWVIKLDIDVLETYKTDILSSECIIEATEEYRGNSYLADSPSWISTVKTKTDVKKFSNGLLDNGEYILITAGGGVIQP